MKVAITGSIGSGKSEVCNYLRECGYDVFDCDKVNKDILDQSAYELLYDDFKDCFDNNILNKQKLANLVFANKQAKDKLESIMHPLILKELLNRQDDPLFAEVPLLFESNWEKYFDESILIIANEKDIVERLINRGLDKEDAINRLKNQMSVVEKAKKATRIIYNNGTLSDLYSLIDCYLKDIKC